MEAHFKNIAYEWEMLITDLYKTVNQTLSCGYTG